MRIRNRLLGFLGRVKVLWCAAIESVGITRGDVVLVQSHGCPDLFIRDGELPAFGKILKETCYDMSPGFSAQTKKQPLRSFIRSLMSGKAGPVIITIRQGMFGVSQVMSSLRELIVRTVSHGVSPVCG